MPKNRHEDQQGHARGKEASGEAFEFDAEADVGKKSFGW